MKGSTVTSVVAGLGLIVCAGLVASVFVDFNQKTYEKETTVALLDDVEAAELKEETVPEKVPFIATHVSTPEPVKALYMTSWVAGTPSIRKQVESLIDSTEINSVVIDIKDSTGKVAFLLDDHPELAEYGSAEDRVPNIREIIANLHNKDVYVIGRISVFQDPYLAEARPDLAVKREDNGGVWKDRKGLAFLDMQSQEVWDYIVGLAKASYEVGFDEINFDYVRFPSDGDIKNIAYNLGEGETRADVMERFFIYLSEQLAETGMTTSADLFGMVTTNYDDLGIGQVLEKALPHFDFIAPMVYPSHYPSGFNGYGNPNHYPYEVVHLSMATAASRAEAIGESRLKLRPWLQDFDYGGNYDVAEVQAQIKATYDAGLTSWMIWDPSNKYTDAAYLPETEETI